MLKSLKNYIFSQIMNSDELIRRTNEETGRKIILGPPSFPINVYLIYSNNEDNYRSKMDENNENKDYDSITNNQIVWTFEFFPLR